MSSPLEQKILGVGAQTGKNPPWGGMDIFWNYTFSKYDVK